MLRICINDSINIQVVFWVVAHIFFSSDRELIKKLLKNVRGCAQLTQIKQFPVFSCTLQGALTTLRNIPDTCKNFVKVDYPLGIG